MDILSILVRSNDFSNEDLEDQLLTFLAAGHETTSSALTWAIYLMAIHTDWQTKLREEIHAAIPSPSDPNSAQPDHTIIDSLPILNAVIQETLRLLPHSSLSVRTATRPTSITLPNFLSPSNPPRNPYAYLPTCNQSVSAPLGSKGE
ncbi:hypothetical protein DID88_005949 [Monilinia fructigena]|uniref:Cytochrome P450 n=1 Tax=Monilinia fructigena TaxID=38457 RepID=A0A395J2C2_9HELO|nr:hypothetical protein DID88_005949 [Monilinia fructigena]